MKFAPGTDPKKAQEALIAAGYPAPQTPGAATSASSTTAAASPSTPTPATPPRRKGGGLRAGRREGRRQAGMNFGLMPTEVIEQTRGRGYGLSYLPQQRTGKQIKFGGGGPQNVINFNPIMSQQANPNIRIGVGGAQARQTSNPQLTSSPIQESGPGSVYTGPNTGNFEEGPGNQTQPTYETAPLPTNEVKDPKTTEPQPPKDDKPKNNYQKRMNRYMRKYDRTAYGAGSSRGTDRFSAADIRKMFRAGQKFGGTKKQAARDVLAYARRNRKKTKMGGTAKKQLDKLQQMLGRRRSEEKKRKSMTAKQQRKLDKKQRARAKKKVRKYNKARKSRQQRRRKNRK